MKTKQQCLKALQAANRYGNLSASQLAALTPEERIEFQQEVSAYYSGPSTAAQIQVIFRLPTQVKAEGPSFDGCAKDKDIVTCTLPTLGAGASKTIGYGFAEANVAAVSTLLTASVQVSTDRDDKQVLIFDATLMNNTATFLIQTA